jgi:2',3'-cyclic-nucleotide 2'-phosphodiesterase/3'-nucleotidase
MKDYAPSEALRSIPEVKEAHEKTIAFVNGGTKNADGTVSGGVFGTASADFQPVNEIKGIPEGKLRDTAVMTLINKVQLLNSGADVSAAALFKDTSDIKAGPINYGTIFGIYKFDNTLYKVEVTGAEMKAYMEWSAACYNQWKPGDISISFNPEKPGYLYDMFAGLDYQIDLSKPAGQRIVNVMFKGHPLADDEKLMLAVNNYRYSSGLKAQKLVAGKRCWESSNSIRDMLVAYIKEQGTLKPEVNNNWSIVGVDLSSPYRDEVIKMVNDGKLEVPYAKSLNVNDLKAAGVIK